MVKKIVLRSLLALVVVILGFVAVVAMQPNQYRVERSATISAPISKVFANVNDFHKWDAWSPWAKLDPNCENSFEGADAGKGAKFHWSGNDKVGEGSMTILESEPNDHIRIKLDFRKPFEDTCDVLFSFKKEGDQTQVRWRMEGKNNFIAKAMCLFMNMEKMIGGDFEKGLAQMKSVVEGDAKQ